MFRNMFREQFPLAEPEFKHTLTRPQVQGIDGQPVGLVIKERHKPSDQGPESARRMP